MRRLASPLGVKLTATTPVDDSQPSLAMDPNEDAPRNDTDLLFVYGTLKSGFNNAPAQSLRRSAELVGPATLAGRMYAVCGPRGALRYPAVVPSDDPRELVHGELYRLHDRRVLDQLDAYEGCGAESPLPHEYVRDVATVALPSGDRRSAYVYWYARPVERLKRLPEGVF